MTAPARSASSGARPRVGFVIEQTLGHITHGANLTRLVPEDGRIRAEFAPVAFELDPRWSRVPGHGNWTMLGHERPHLDEWEERRW